MNYGYDENSKGWKDDKKLILAETLSKELKLKTENNFGGEEPYIEVDGLYRGVRIRKITHLSDKERDDLVLKSDKIYNEIMG